MSALIERPRPSGMALSSSGITPSSTASITKYSPMERAAAVPQAARIRGTRIAAYSEFSPPRR